MMDETLEYVQIRLQELTDYWQEMASETASSDERPHPITSSEYRARIHAAILIANMIGAKVRIHDEN